MTRRTDTKLPKVLLIISLLLQVGSIIRHQRSKGRRHE